MYADSTTTNEFVLRRLTDAFPFSSTSSSGSTLWHTVFLWGTVSLLVLLALGSVAWSLRRRTKTTTDFIVAGVRFLIFAVPAGLITLAQMRSGSLNALVPDDDMCWWILTISMFLLGVTMTVMMYIRDSATVKLWSVFLAPLRVIVYATLAFAFLLPSCQKIDTSEKTSRVVIIIDVSPSMSRDSDDIIATSGGKQKTRLEKTIDLLTDETVQLIQQLREKNPISIYRFGSRLDEDNSMMPRVDGQESKGWSRADYNSWLNYDFKHYIKTQRTSDNKLLWPEEIVLELEAHEAWKPEEPGNHSWATTFASTIIKLPDSMKDREAKQATLDSLMKKLKDRVDVAKQIALYQDKPELISTGSNVPDSLLSALNRESPNMVQAIIMISDGRSNMGSESSIVELRERAIRERIPIFTITAGEARDNIAIDITDLQGPKIVQPDDPVSFTVEADGVGLNNQSVTARLQFFLPGKDPKKDEASFEMTKELKFAPGEPPHGMVQFPLDADELAKDPVGKDLVEPSKKTGRKFQLKSGTWHAVAKIARDKRETFPEPDHVFPKKNEEQMWFEVVEKPLRVLLFASGPSREYQTLRTLLVREMKELRAEVSIYLQMEGGTTGEIVQDVPPERLLTRFPDRLDTNKKLIEDNPEGKLAKYYNLDEYDLIIALDPDWNEKDKAGNNRISDTAIANVRTWVNNLGGGIMYVAGPVHTFQLARTDAQVGRLKPLLEILPVLPDDLVLIKQFGVPRDPRRLGLKPNPESPDLLKLEESKIETAGWEKYFTGRDEFRRSDTPGADENPKRGFFAYYPVKSVKPGANVWAEFWGVDEKKSRIVKPYLVTTNSGSGRSGYMGSGETYRLRAENPAYFDRFWLNFGRYLSSKREAKASRGRLLMNKDFIAGGQVRIQARLLSPTGEPYAESAVQPKLKIDQYAENGDFIKKIDLVEMKPRKSGDKFDGYYTAQFNADARRFPFDKKYRYLVTMDVPDSPGDVFKESFTLKASIPEIQNRKPDFAAMTAMAGTFKEIRSTTIDTDALKVLLPNVDVSKPDSPEVVAAKEKTKLAYKLADYDQIKMIPKCLDSESKSIQTIGAPNDLWDKSFEELRTIWFRKPEIKPAQIRDFMRREFVGIPLWVVLSVPLALATLVLFFLSTRFYNALGQTIRMAALFAGVLTAFVVFLAFYFPIGAVVWIVATLLSIEWLSRKLLRLA